MSDPPGLPPPSTTETLVGSEPASRNGRRPLARGESVGRYVVLDPLGAGGMGIVYAAYDPELDRRVAIKLIQSASDPDRAATARARLVREAQALAKLNHPNIIAVHDVGTFGGQVFVAMEYVDGCDLAAWLRDGPRAWQEIVAIFLDAGRGLSAAHAAGIVHRDFKPENVLIGNDGRVRVLDFGLAHGASSDESRDVGDSRPLALSEEHSEATNDPDQEIGRSRASQLSTRLTQAGAIVGTPAYMSPEQHLGRRTDARTDQFSFCVALYEALYRQRPFPGATPHELMFSVLKGKLTEPPRSTVVPGWVRRVLQTGLAVDPDGRFSSMNALLQALAPEPRQRTQRYGAALVVAAVGAIAAWAAWPSVEPSAPEPCRGAERKLEGIWDDAVRTRVREAFLATDRPYADDAFSTSARFLDAYAQRFVELHTDACEATAIRKEQSQQMLDRQMMCLHRRLREVEELTRLFTDADDEVVQRAVAAAGRLSPLDTCADRQQLAQTEAPLSGVQAERAVEIDGMLAGAEQRLRLARYEPGLKLARAALTAAQTHELPRHAAIALELRGRTEDALGRYGDAERTLYESLWAAEAAGDDRQRAEVWSTLVWVVGYRLGRYDEAERMGAHAMHALTRGGGDDIVLAELHNNLGTAAKAHEDLARAIAEYERALALRRRLPRDHPDVAASLANLATAHVTNGTFDIAEPLLGEAQELTELTFGPNHPRTASLLHARALLAYRQGHVAEAIERLRRVVLVREASLSAVHEETALAIHDLGEALLASADASAALVQFSRAVEIKRSNREGDHVSLANSLAGVGRARAMLGETAAAANALQDALAMFERLGSTGSLLAETRLALAELLAATHPSRARALASAAREFYAASGTHAPEITRLDALDTRLASPARPR